ncbi:MAG: SGNH/GDSL hydrolase family protein [Chloroflexi bacterium]|nr:SGNH/GDSL hydrolase family protein [Chloroflexota bacterium]
MTALLAIIALLLLIEFALRIRHRQTLAPTCYQALRSKTRALDRTRLVNKYRIVVFGDSIAHGEDLLYNQSYPHILSDLLNRQNPATSIAVINSGIRGCTSVLALDWLDAAVLRYKPHMVLLAFGLNDGKLGDWPLDRIRERAMFQRMTLLGRLDDILRKHCHLYLTLMVRVRRLLRQWGYVPLAAWSSTFGPRVSQEGFTTAQRELVRRIRRRSGAVICLLTTTPVDERSGRELDPASYAWQQEIYEKYNEVIRHIAAQEGTHLIDLASAFGALSPERIASLLQDDGVHLTAEGERVVAEHVAEALQQMGVLRAMENGAHLQIRKGLICPPAAEVRK